jgi:hypothetical protein
MGEKMRQKKKGSKKDAELDKYSLLGLDKERYLATEKQIKDGETLFWTLFHTSPRDFTLYHTHSDHEKGCRFCQTGFASRE